MPRASDGTVTLPVGNPVVAGTAISADVANATNADLASMIEDSLSRSGKGGMNAPMQFANGSAANPSIAFTSDPDTGVYLPAAGDIGFVANGVKTLDVLATGVVVAGDSYVSGNSRVIGTLQVDGTVTATGGFVGITRANVPTPAYIQSSSCAGFTSNTVGPKDVTNFSITLATTGSRPVVIMVVPDGTNTYGYLSCKSSLGTGQVRWVLQRNGNLAGQTAISAELNTENFLENLMFFDSPGPAGNYTYKIVTYVDAATTTSTVNQMTMIAYEL
jgi:hypothetical protein